MTDQPLTAADQLLQAAEELQRNPQTGLFQGIHPSRSMKRSPALAAETEVLWLDPNAPGMAWLRESFPPRRPRGAHVRALTLDSAGRVVRAFTATPEAIAAYARGLALGTATCPLEAVAPWTIQPGMPAAPAHAFLAPQMYANIAASEGTPVKLPAANMQSTPQKLAEIESAFWEGMRPPRL